MRLSAWLRSFCVFGLLFATGMTEGQAARYYIGRAGYAGPEATHAYYRNYDAIDMNTFLATLVTGDEVMFVDDSAVYQDDSLLIATPSGVTFSGKAGETIVIKSTGSANNYPAGGDPRSACAVRLG